jgi:putative transposase
LEKLNQALNRRYRQAFGIEGSPSVGILDAQSVKKSEWGLPHKGFDGYKHINVVKRQLIVDTLELVLAVSLHAANEHDGQGAKAVIEVLVQQGYKRLEKILADRGYRGQFVNWFTEFVHWRLEIVAGVIGISLTFQVTPQRWKVERTISWLQWHRRLVKDYETEPSSSQAFVYLFNVQRIIQRI